MCDQYNQSELTFGQLFTEALPEEIQLHIAESDPGAFNALIRTNKRFSERLGKRAAAYEQSLMVTIRGYDSVEHFCNGRLHHRTLPASTYRDGAFDSRTEWYFAGKLHRVDGPAVISVSCGDLFNEYWLNGEEVGYEEHSAFCAN